MEDASRADVPTTPPHRFGPVAARTSGTPAPDEVPEVADAVGARAHGLRQVAEQIDAEVAGVDDAIARALRTHAGAVDALAAHLRDVPRPASS